MIFDTISFYGGLSLSRIIFQIVTSAVQRQKQYHLSDRPMASLIIATYNESKEAFLPALQSFKNQTYKQLEIIVVDDGSNNAGDIKEICDRFNVKYALIPHAGKRHAMYAGFGLIAPTSKIILTADSDTIWNKNAALELIKSLMSSPKNGAVTGYVGVSNKDHNLLTQLIGMRYWMAFNQERASQSMFGAVTCVSGPMGAYRREIIDRIKYSFVTQKFLGRPCTFGDDRHLTNLVLNEGYQVGYSNAKCYTDAPTTIKKYIKQQVRWTKSYWREMFWQFRVLKKHGLYLAYDWSMTVILPFLLLGSLLHYLYRGATDPTHIYTLFTTIIVMSFIRIIDPIRVTKNPLFLLFIFYSFFWLFVLLPIQIYSLFTINLTHWGSRNETPTTTL